LKAKPPKHRRTMNSKDLLRKYSELRDEEHGPRKIGRYYSSELAKIRLGWFKPKDFFDPKPIDDTGLGNINRGVAYEEHWAKIFKATKTGLKHEPTKLELEIDDFVIVSKPDFISKTAILEMKTPTIRTLNNYIFKGKIPSWYQPQLDAYYRTFNKQVFLAVGYDTETQNFNLATIRYEPNEVLWQKTLEALRDFHAKLLKLNK